MSHRTLRFVLEQEVSEAPVMADDGVDPAGQIEDINQEFTHHYDDLCQLQDQAKEYTTVLESFPPGCVITPKEEALLKSFVNLSLAGTGVSTESFKSFRDKGITFALEAAGGGFWNGVKRVIQAIIDAIKRFFSWLTGSKGSVEKKQAEAKAAIEKFASMVEGTFSSDDFQKEMEGHLKEFAKSIQGKPVGKVTGSKLSDWMHVKPTHDFVSGEAIIKAVGDDLHAFKEWACGPLSEVFEEFGEVHQFVFGFGATTEAAEADAREKAAAEDAKATQGILTLQSKFENVLKMHQRSGVNHTNRMSQDSVLVPILGCWYLEVDPKTLKARVVKDTSDFPVDKEFDVMAFDSSVSNLKHLYDAKCRELIDLYSHGGKSTGEILKELEKSMSNAEREIESLTGDDYRSKVRQSGLRPAEKEIMHNFPLFGLSMSHAFGKAIHIAISLDVDVCDWYGKTHHQHEQEASA